MIVNPVAGLGGTVGLKGSDGAEMQRKARELGAVPESLSRAVVALLRIAPHKEQIDVVTYPHEMGEDAAVRCGFEPTVIGSIRKGQTTAEDTRNASREMLDLGVELVLFAGGDGTARDVCSTIGEAVPALGIPSGVKIHSAVFGISPGAAGELAVLYLLGRVRGVREAEVMDVDEEAVRQGIVSARLYGYLKIPFRRSLVQGAKAASSVAEQASVQSIARDVVRCMEEDRLYIIGPGTTTRAIVTQLGLNKTLLGVDVVLNGELVGTDVNESQLLELIEGRSAKIIVTPIGGQGYIFGRGNQQISPAVISKVGRGGVIVVSTAEKINDLGGRPLLVDTGNETVDAMLSGYVRVITGYNEETVYRVFG